MKKSLVALAVLAASGASFAQSSVTLYGLLDIWAGSVKGADGVSNTAMGSGGVDGSRFGFKGSEDLGGGLKAGFKLENVFSLDTGAAGTYGSPFTGAPATAPTAAFSNYAYVSLSGGFGDLKLGLVGTALDEVTGAGNAVFNSALSAEKATWKSSGYSWPGNGVMYVSPDMSGFSGIVSYSLGENKTATVGAGDVTSFALKYEGGPAYVALGYQADKADGAASAKKFTQLNGFYDLGVAKLQAAFGKVTQSGTADVSEYELGATAPVSTALAVSANYASSKTQAYGAAAEIKRSGYGLGGAYTLSKRTFLYGGYRSETAEQAGSADVKTSLFAVGVHHTF
jgi:predicted porin